MLSRSHKVAVFTRPNKFQAFPFPTVLDGEGEAFKLGQNLVKKIELLLKEEEEKRRLDSCFSRVNSRSFALSVSLCLHRLKDLGFRFQGSNIIAKKSGLRG